MKNARWMAFATVREKKLNGFEAGFRKSPLAFDRGSKL
jgi:hypothetical protein